MSGITALQADGVIEWSVTEGPQGSKADGHKFNLPYL